MKSRFFRLSLFSFAVFFLFCLIQKAESITENEQNSSPPLLLSENLTKAPDFTLENLSGEPVSLKSLEGNVVVLTFWATWCPACRKEISHLNELTEKYKDKNVKIIGISLDRGGAKTVIPFYEKNNMNYPVLIGTDETVKSFDGIYGIPTTFIINQEGYIVKKLTGLQGAAKLGREIDALLNKTAMQISLSKISSQVRKNTIWFD